MGSITAPSTVCRLDSRRFPVGQGRAAGGPGVRGSDSEPLLLLLAAAAASGRVRGSAGLGMAVARLVPLPGAAWLDARGLRPGWVQVRVFALTFVTVSAVVEPSLGRAGRAED